jgi:hypothetical protein
MNTTEVHQDLIGKPYADIIERLVIESDGGDCCGWADCEQTGVIPEGVDTSTLTLKGCVEITYDEDYGREIDRRVLNFIFTTPNGSEVLLGYELSAGSGSGWSYGAWVTIKLDDKVLAEASW